MPCVCPRSQGPVDGPRTDHRPKKQINALWPLMFASNKLVRIRNVSSFFVNCYLLRYFAPTAGFSYLSDDRNVASTLLRISSTRHLFSFQHNSPRGHQSAIMNIDDGTEARLRTLHLDDTLLELDSQEEAFFKSETGIQDTEELMKHIIEVQQDAYKVSLLRAEQVRSRWAVRLCFLFQVYPYPCIRGFRFTRLKISRMPAYPRVLELGKTRPDAIFLDIGCCREDKFVHGEV